MLLVVGFCLAIIFCLILIPQSEAIGKNLLKMKDIILRAIFFLVITNVFNCIEIKLIKSLDENLLSSSTSRSISPLSGNNLELEKIFNEVSIKLEDKKSDGKKLLKSSSKGIRYKKKKLNKSLLILY